MSKKFSKDLRLRTKSDFNNLKKSSSTDSSGIVRAFFVKNELGRPRLGIAVSKKFGNAVRRNRYKRIIRESFRQESANLKTVDVLFTLNRRQFNETENEFIEQKLKDGVQSLLNRFSKK